MRKTLLALALSLAGGRLMAAACDPVGDVVNAFETAGTCPSDIAAWTGAQALNPVAGPHINPEGGFYGRTASWVSLSFVTHTLPNAAFPDDFSGHDYLFVAYATTQTTSAGYSPSIILTSSPSGQALQFRQGATLVTRTAAAYASSAAEWSYMAVSLNYAKNLGINLTNIGQLQLQLRSVAPSNGHIAYDRLGFGDGVNTPHNGVPSGVIGASVSCAGLTLTWTAQAPSGTDPISGYHLYRSTVSATGPWVSLQYVALSQTSYVDNIFGSTTQFYAIMPYSSVTASLAGGNIHHFSGLVTLDGAWPGSFGVNEALISAPVVAGPFNPFAGCSPTPSPSPSSTRTPSPTITPSATETPTSTDSPTRTNSPTASATSSNTSTITPSSTVTGSPSNTPNATNTITPTITVTSTISTTNSPGPSATFTSTITPTSTITMTFSLTSTGVPANTFTNTPSVTPTFTATATFSHSPVVTPTIDPNAGAQLYPNPFNPDKGEDFHLGNVPPGEAFKIYNIIGEFVYGSTTKGNPTADRWDGVNANGVKVVTGIYFLQIQGKLYRVAVVRE